MSDATLPLLAAAAAVSIVALLLRANTRAAALDRAYENALGSNKNQKTTAFFARLAGLFAKWRAQTFPKRPTQYQLLSTYAQCVAELAATVRSGISLNTAWEVAAETVGESECDPALTQWGRCAASVHAAIQTGCTISAAVSKTAEATDPGIAAATMHQLASVLAVCERTGAAPASALDRLAKRWQDKADGVAAIEVSIAGPQSTAKVLTWLPVGGLALGQLSGVEPIAVLVTSPVGISCACAAIALMLIARRWTRSLIDSVREPNSLRNRRKQVRES